MAAADERAAALAAAGPLFLKILTITLSSYICTEKILKMAKPKEHFFETE